MLACPTNFLMFQKWVQDVIGIKSNLKRVAEQYAYCWGFHWFYSLLKLLTTVTLLLLVQYCRHGTIQTMLIILNDSTDLLTVQIDCAESPLASFLVCIKFVRRELGWSWLHNSFIYNRVTGTIKIAFMESLNIHVDCTLILALGCC